MSPKCLFKRHRDAINERRFTRRIPGPDALAPDSTWRGGGGGPRGRGGLGRFFAHGDLRLVVLNLIAEKPRHGYEIIKSIEEQVAGAYSPSPGVIYPTLTLLEELGHIEAEAVDGGKKLHRITAQGRQYLEANQTTLDPLLTRMREAGQAAASLPPPQLLRAMENLKLALRLRLNTAPLSPEQIATVAAAIDAIAQQVETL